MTKNYDGLAKLKTFEERFDYLKLDGVVGAETFGSDRYLNQVFYRSPEWKAARDYVILRDNGCDLGIDDRPIKGRSLLIHHIVPITPQDILNRASSLFDPNNLITTTRLTHDALHFGDESLLPHNPIQRRPNDTCPWKEKHDG